MTEYPIPDRIGPAEFGTLASWITVRCPSELDSLVQAAGQSRRTPDVFSAIGDGAALARMIIPQTSLGLALVLEAACTAAEVCCSFVHSLRQYLVKPTQRCQHDRCREICNRVPVRHRAGSAVL